jgi:hypothetical protein
MTLLDGKKIPIDPRFDPNAAAMIFADVVQVNAAIGEKDPTALGDENLRRQASEARGAIKRYAADYFSAWTKGLAVQAEPQTPASWTDAKKQIGDLASGSSNVFRDLRLVSEVMKTVITAPGLKESEGVGADEMQRWIDAISSDLSKLEDTGYRSARELDMTDRFGKLPATVADAKTRIGDLTGENFRQRFLRDMPNNPEGGRGLGQRYWDMARIRFIEALAIQFGTESGNLLRNKAAFRKMPLVMERGAEAGGALSVDEIKQFSNALPSVAEVQKTGGGPESALAAGGQTGVVPADSALATMFGGERVRKPAAAPGGAAGLVAVGRGRQRRGRGEGDDLVADGPWVQ